MIQKISGTCSGEYGKIILTILLCDGYHINDLEIVNFKSQDKKINIHKKYYWTDSSINSNAWTGRLLKSSVNWFE